LRTWRSCAVLPFWRNASQVVGHHQDKSGIDPGVGKGISASAATLTPTCFMVASALPPAMEAPMTDPGYLLVGALPVDLAQTATSKVSVLGVPG
jgi:hypothetical protein